MFYCLSNWHPSNIMRATDGSIVILDFAEANILPASFVLFLTYHNKLPFSITDNFIVPGARADSVKAVHFIAGNINRASRSFSTVS